MAASCDSVTNVCGSPTCPAQLQCLTNVIFPRVVVFAEIFVGIVALAMIIFAGFRYITSQADKKTIEGANKTLFYAALGLFMVLFSFFIMNIIGEATGVTCIEPKNLISLGANIFDACK